MLYVDSLSNPDMSELPNFSSHMWREGRILLDMLKTRERVNILDDYVLLNSLRVSTQFSIHSMHGGKLKRKHDTMSSAAWSGNGKHQRCEVEYESSVIDDESGVEVVKNILCLRYSRNQWLVGPTPLSLGSVMVNFKH